MTSEQEIELIDFLSSIGFEGPGFTEELKKRIILGTPRFSITDKKNYGKEQMFFELHFKQDHQFNAYRLERFTATHRKAINIDHKTINGIDTGILEQRMQRENWQDYFGKQQGYQHKLDQLFVKDTLAMLNKLSEGQNFDGIKIQEELMFKYWPTSAYDRDSKQDLKHLFEHSRDFQATEYGMCNTHLAYYIVSGKLDELFEKLDDMGLERYPGIDLYHELEKTLSRDPDRFEIKCHYNQPEGFAEYIIPIQKINGDLEPENYKIIFTPYPDIEHAVCNGIDSHQLESMMQKVDWHNDTKLFIFHEDSEPEFRPKVADIQERMYRLSQDLAGADIADRLQLKYWADATFFDSVIGQSAWDYMETLPKKEEEFPCHVEAFVAFNLMCGRAVQQHFVMPHFGENASWLRLDPGNQTVDGFIHIDGYSGKELESAMGLLPLSNLDYYRILDSLKRGGLPSVILRNEREVLLQANPEQTISVYTPDKRPIYTNINFDADWMPPIKTAQNAKEIAAPQVRNAAGKNRVFIRKNRKGRGL
jgi:hypothetical protein